MQPTAEQEIILGKTANDSTNLMVNALAGCGKTTTLQMIQAVSKTKPVLCVAFNKRAAEDMEKKFGGGSTTIRTFNGLGHRVWMKTVSKISLEPKKTQQLVSEHIKELKGDVRKEVAEEYWEIVNGVSLAKALGYVPDGKYEHARRLITEEEFTTRLDEKPSPVILETIDIILLESIRRAYKGWIDYNDQIYMPALFGGTFPRFPLVLVDEEQDLNPVNHAMLDKLIKGRHIGVGDPWQSIYAFRGAVQSGMGVIKDKFACEELDLSISFRCPQAVVNHALWRVPHLKSNKPGGHVEVLRQLYPREIPEGAAILCRNNAPLFRTALGLLMRKRSCTVTGSEIGPKLIATLRKICDADDNQDQMLGKIESWRAERIVNSNTPGSINDMADCMAIFASFGRTLSEATSYIEHVFKQQGAIKLMTGHKAKGGEWDVVYHLDPWLIGEDEQELNLWYVITTRSAERLYEIDSVNIKWNS